MRRLLAIGLLLLAVPSWASQIGVVYSKSTGRIRSVIVPTKDSELDSFKPQAGEEILKFVNNGPFATLDALQTSVTTVTGKVPVSDRYAVVSATGAVVGAIIADPALDSIKGFQLIQSDVAGPGWTYSPGIGFIKPVSPIPLTHSDTVISR